MTSFKTVLAAGVACAALCAGSASAQTVDELEAKIEALEAALNALKADVEAQRETSSATSDGLIRLEARTEEVAKASAASAPAAGFKMGDATVTVGGFVDFDVNVTDTSDGEIAGSSIARDFYIPSATPVGGVGEGEPDTDMTAEASRFYVDAKSETGGVPIQAHLELDFLGSGQGNEVVSNSFSPRLRRAYFRYGKWLFGQEWSTFQNTSTIPSSASFLALSDGMVFDRQPQVRYTSGPWQFAIENSNTREIGSGATDDGVTPDLVGKYTSSGEWGNVSFAGLLRGLKDERFDVATGSNKEEGAMGYGLSVAGDVKLTDSAGLKFSLTGGEGIGRYVGLAAIGDARFDAAGDLEAISAVGGLLALHGKLGPKSSGTIGYSGLFADAELGETESVQSVLGVYAYQLAPKTSVAAEIMHGRREIVGAPGADTSGDITRLTFSTKHAF